MSVIRKKGVRPNRKIWEFGNYYLDAALLCWENRLLLPATINAALAIELYLKSFLAIDWYDGEGRWLGFKAEHGHHFTEDLIDKFEEDDRNKLFSVLEGISEARNWYALFEKYGNTFKKTKYWYESDAAVALDFEIIDLAKNLREAVVLAARCEIA